LEFRVVRDRATAEAFHAQLIACYARYGASAAAIAPPVADVVYLVVETERHMVAGIRLHRRGANRLPLESYFAQEPAVIDALDRRSGDGLAELCGLWSAPEVARTGIGGRVVGAAVAIAPYFGVRHLCSFAHQFNRFTRRVGFLADERVGDRPYPDARYRSTLNWCDAVAVTGADADVREQICRLRHAAGTVTAGERLPLALDLRS
jgi:hypothetical protein